MACCACTKADCGFWNCFNLCCNCTCYNEPVATAQSADGKVKLLATRSPIFVYNDFGKVSRANTDEPYTQWAVFWLFDVQITDGGKDLNLHDKDDISIIDHVAASDGTPMLVWGDCCLSGLVYVNNKITTNVYKQQVDKFKADHAAEAKTNEGGVTFLEVDGKTNYNIKQAKRFEVRQNLYYVDREDEYIPSPEVANLPVCDSIWGSRCWQCCCIFEDFLCPPCYGVCCRE